MGKRTCTEDGCGRPHQAKGLCSPHYSAAYKAKHGTSYRRPARDRQCEVCGATYTTTSWAGKTCSHACRNFINPRVALVVDIPWAQCRQCDGWYVRRGAGGSCGPCRDRAAAPLPTRMCERCGQSYQPTKAWQGPQTQRFCSMRCKHRNAANTPEARMRARIRDAYRKSLERGDNGAFTLSEWGARLKEYGRRCAYCQDPDAMVEIEHVIPLCRGGTNRIANVVPACRACNQDKGTLTPQEWRDSGRPRVHKVVHWPEGQRGPELLPDPCPQRAVA